MSNLGQTVAIDLVASAAGAAITATAAAKASALRKKFQKILQSDQDAIDYIKYITIRLKEVGANVVSLSNLRPGTYEFEKELQKKLLSDLIYKGDCNADIYEPLRPEDKAGEPRRIIGNFKKDGTIGNPASNVPRETGLHWASGCKSGFDLFRARYLDKEKESLKHKTAVAQKEDLTTLALFVRFGLGLFLTSAVLVAITLK